MIHQEEKRSDSIQALSRAIEILQGLRETPEGATSRSLAQLMGLSPATTRRILESLEASNMVIPCANGYRLGPALVRMGQSVYSYDFISTLHPLLLHLASSTGETVNLTVISRDRAMVVDQAVGHHFLMAATRVGGALPMHSTACGKALLAILTQDELEDFRMNVPLHAFTPKTLVEWTQLDAELESIRRRGLAFDHQEHAQGVCSIATPLVIPGTVPVAVSVPIPTSRYREVEPKVCEALSEFRQAVFRRWQDKPRAVPA